MPKKFQLNTLCVKIINVSGILTETAKKHACVFTFSFSFHTYNHCDRQSLFTFTFNALINIHASYKTTFVQEPRHLVPSNKLLF